MTGTECNGCGSCCHPVLLPYSLTEAARMVGKTDPVDLHWMLTALTPMRPKEAKALEPWLFERPMVGPEPDDVLTFHYRCRFFDEETRRCTDYENRPPICRRYPWIHGYVEEGAALPPTCSFRADIGQPVELGPTRG